MARSFFERWEKVIKGSTPMTQITDEKIAAFAAAEEKDPGSFQDIWGAARALLTAYADMRKENEKLHDAVWKMAERAAKLRKEKNAHIADLEAKLAEAREAGLSEAAQFVESLKHESGFENAGSIAAGILGLISRDRAEKGGSHG